MKKEIRSTVYLEEDLYNRFREACNRKFGDKQGKIKQGIVLAVTEFTNKELGTPQDVTEVKQNTPPISAKKLNSAKKENTVQEKTVGQIIQEDVTLREAEASVRLDQDSNLQTVTEEDIEAKAKKLAEERRKKESQETEHKVLS